MAKSSRPVSIPIHGSADHNAAFLLSIGGLVVNWANNESVFLAMLQVLVSGDKLTASIVWHSHRSTNARLDLVMRLIREQVAPKDRQLADDIGAAISKFKGFSRVRNFFCHAMYEYDDNLALRSATGATFPAEGKPIVLDTKGINRATLNEIKDTSTKLAEFNQRLWALVVRLQGALGRQHVRLPRLPGANPSPTERPPPKDEESKP